MRTLATLGDVAQRAGTSVATTGRALGGYGKVAAATRDRVLAAAGQPTKSLRTLGPTLARRLCPNSLEESLKPSAPDASPNKLN